VVRASETRRGRWRDASILRSRQLSKTVIVNKRLEIYVGMDIGRELLALRKRFAHKITARVARSNEA